MLKIKLGVNIELKKFCISLPKMHGQIRIDLPKVYKRICIGLPKVYGWFPIGPPQVSHAICPHQISTVGEFRGAIAIMQEKH